MKVDRLILLLTVTALVILLLASHKEPLLEANLSIDCEKINSFQEIEFGAFGELRYLLIKGSFNVPQTSVFDPNTPVTWNASSKAELMNVFWDLEPYAGRTPLNSFLEAENYFISINPGRPRMAMTHSGDMVIIEINNRN